MKKLVKFYEDTRAAAQEIDQSLASDLYCPGDIRRATEQLDIVVGHSIEVSSRISNGAWSYVTTEHRGGVCMRIYLLSNLLWHFTNLQDALKEFIEEERNALCHS